MTQADISRRTGFKQADVSRYLTLLELDDQTLRDVDEGFIGVEAAIAAVRETRASRRGRTVGRPVQVERPHLTKGHPLATVVFEMCEHTKRPPIGRVGCGQCWEQAIRNDALGQPRPTPARQIDEAAVLRATGGEAMDLNIAEREEAVRRLHRQALSDAQIAERLHITDRTVLRIRQRLDLPSNYDSSPERTSA